MDKCILPILGGSRPQRKPAKVRKGEIFPHLSWNSPSSPWPPPHPPLRKVRVIWSRARDLLHMVLSNRIKMKAFEPLLLYPFLVPSPGTHSWKHFLS